jgi:hypothetical protein
MARTSLSSPQGCTILFFFIGGDGHDEYACHLGTSDGFAAIPQHGPQPQARRTRLVCLNVFK